METASLADFSGLHELFCSHQLESFLTLHCLLFFRVEGAPIQGNQDASHSRYFFDFSAG